MKNDVLNSLVSVFCTNNISCQAFLRDFFSRCENSLEGVMYIIRNEIERIDYVVIEKLKRLPAFTVFDAIGKYGAMTHEIKPLM